MDALLKLFTSESLTAAPRFDMSLSNGDVEADTSLQTAVLVSLFTDNRALPDDPHEGDARGWWGNSVEGLKVNEVGSRLWLLRRRKQSEETRLLSITYAKEALAWVVDKGFAESVEVEAEWVALSHLKLRVTLIRFRQSPLVVDVDNLWQILMENS